MKKKLLLVFCFCIFVGTMLYGCSSDSSVKVETTVETTIDDDIHIDWKNEKVEKAFDKVEKGMDTVVDAPIKGAAAVADAPAKAVDKIADFAEKYGADTSDIRGLADEIRQSNAEALKPMESAANEMKDTYKEQLGEAKQQVDKAVDEVKDAVVNEALDIFKSLW